MIDVPGRSPLGFCFRSPLGVKNMALPDIPLPNWSPDISSVDLATVWWETNIDTLGSLVMGHTPSATLPYGNKTFEYEWTLQRNQRGIRFQSLRYIDDVVVITPTPLIINETGEIGQYNTADRGGIYTCLEGGFILNSYYGRLTIAPGNVWRENPADPDGPLIGYLHNNKRQYYNLGGKSDYFEQWNTSNGWHIGDGDNDFTETWAQNILVAHDSETITFEQLIACGFNPEQGKPLKLYATLIPEGWGRCKFDLYNVNEGDSDIFIFSKFRSGDYSGTNEVHKNTLSEIFNGIRFSYFTWDRNPSLSNSFVLVTPTPVTETVTGLLTTYTCVEGGFLLRPEWVTLTTSNQYDFNLGSYSGSFINVGDTGDNYPKIFTRGLPAHTSPYWVSVDFLRQWGFSPQGGQPLTLYITYVEFGGAAVINIFNM